MADDPNANVNQGTGDNTNTDKGDGKGDATGDSGAKWYETSIPKDLHEQVQGYESPEAMVKDIVGLKGKLPVVPEKSDGYVVKFTEDVKIPDEVTKPATEMYSKWRELAKEVGLTQEQYSRLISADAKIRLEQTKKNQEAFSKSESSLKTDWGKDYDTNLSQAEKVVNGIFTEDDVAYFKKSGLANDPRFVKAMFGLAGKLSEDSFIINERKGEDKGPRIDPNTGKPMLSYPSMK